MGNRHHLQFSLTWHEYWRNPTSVLSKKPCAISSNPTIWLFKKSQSGRSVLVSVPCINYMNYESFFCRVYRFLLIVTWPSTKKKTQLAGSPSLYSAEFLTDYPYFIMQNAFVSLYWGTSAQNGKPLRNQVREASSNCFSLLRKDLQSSLDRVPRTVSCAVTRVADRRQEAYYRATSPKRVPTRSIAPISSSFLQMSTLPLKSIKHLLPTYPCLQRTLLA